ncbi:uncharacterized protein BT62DRAFT_284198 [Guyanagaster necrorhizus]|uniref:Uncharacterized protein n=1 Tax=Guyanagaster necrorhizus TaxID=856835 RepID=A0A9P7W481_9AGAR|nr:uncharacterized protein BT62DRAFT_284198 [Guyanagaster necrorhizus MCA 3950]KAG7452125.1 hypothetical protein BT62DRAFT_284198 [Guyanagaster necrorhizus MCA 3950]
MRLQNIRSNRCCDLVVPATHNRSRSFRRGGGGGRKARYTTEIPSIQISILSSSRTDSLELHFRDVLPGETIQDRVFADFPKWKRWARGSRPQGNVATLCNAVSRLPWVALQITTYFLCVRRLSVHAAFYTIGGILSFVLGPTLGHLCTSASRSEATRSRSLFHRGLSSMSNADTVVTFAEHLGSTVMVSLTYSQLNM